LYPTPRTDRDIRADGPARHDVRPPHRAPSGPSARDHPIAARLLSSIPMEELRPWHVLVLGCCCVVVVGAVIGVIVWLVLKNNRRPR